jgi:hypothetical protein
MVVIDFSLKAFINQLTNLQWERLLATLILIAYSFKSRLGSRSHRLETGNDLMSAVGDTAGSPIRATRNTQPDTGIRRVVQNTEP